MTESNTCDSIPSTINCIMEEPHQPSTTDDGFKPLPPDKKFHVFISYRDTDEDKEWVNQLITLLERDHKLKCCNHVYDFQPGMTIVENIKNAVFNSVKTLIVMSKYYKDSYWCKFEVEFSHKLSMDMKQNLIIPVLKETCEIPEHLQAFTYIDGRGPIEEWLPRLVAAIDDEGAWSSSRHVMMPGNILDHQNLDIIYEEKSKLGWCCRKMPFKTRSHIPYALNNRVVFVSDDTYFDALKYLSKAAVFRCRHCLLPWLPTVLISLIIFTTVLVLLAFFVTAYIGTKTRGSDFTVTAASFVCLLLWPVTCVVCFQQRRKLFHKKLLKANKILMENKLIAGFRIYPTSATIGIVFVYFDAYYCMEYVKKLLKKQDKNSVTIDLEHEQTDSGERDELIRSQEPSGQENNIYESLESEAWDLLVNLSPDFIQDFLDEKLEHSERFRHTPQAMCLCEYAQLKNIIPRET